MTTHSIPPVDVSSFQSADHPIIEWPQSNKRNVCRFIGAIITVPYTSQSTTDSMSNAEIIENQSPVEFASVTMPATNDNGFGLGKVTEEVWAIRLQDKGTSEKAEMPSNTYRRLKIPGVGPKGHEVYYYDLTSLAIDILSNMKLENDFGRGWSKVPKNKTDSKIKLVQVIISKR